MNIFGIMQFGPLMVWPSLVPVRPAKACALFPPFEAEVLLLRRERERERESQRVPPPDVEQHTHWGQSLSKCGRSNIETIFQHSRQQTNGRKSLTLCANTTTTSLFTVLCYSFYFSFFSPRSSHFWPQAMMSKKHGFQKVYISQW